MKHMRHDQVADGVIRCGDGFVNWYLIDDGGDLTVIDTAWPRSWPAIEETVASIGRRVGDIRAILLTHGHADHMGGAEDAHQATGLPVRAHRHEEARLRGHKKGGSPLALAPRLLPHLWRPSTLGFVVHAVRSGFLTPRWVTDVLTFDDDDDLDIPGHPRVVFAPGHTEGHCAFHLAERGVLFSADELVMLNPLSGARGPQLMPAALNDQPELARTSLALLEPIAADILLPGHGEPWFGSPTRAVALARQAAG